MGAKPRNNVGSFGKTVAKALEAARRQRQISQTELQKETGISQSQLSKMLRGLRSINLDELDAICSALRIDLADVLELPHSDATVVPFPAASDSESSKESAEFPCHEWVADSSEEELFPGDDGYGEGP